MVHFLRSFSFLYYFPFLIVFFKSHYYNFEFDNKIKQTKNAITRKIILLFKSNDGVDIHQIKLHSIPIIFQ